MGNVQQRHPDPDRLAAFEVRPGSMAELAAALQRGLGSDSVLFHNLRGAA